MARKLGAKNKPKKVLNVNALNDIITPSVASQWLKMSRKELMRKIHVKEIPADCYFMVGNRIKLITNRLAIFFGIKVA